MIDVDADGKTVIIRADDEGLGDLEQMIADTRRADRALAEGPGVQGKIVLIRWDTYAMQRLFRQGEKSDE
jgi:hypothetical protein